jgi:glutathione S-transferase
MRLYDMDISGNCYKVRLLLALLGRDYERVPVDWRAERPEAVRTRGTSGRVPLVELDDGRLLAESSAILWYLAEDTPYLPADRFDRARVLAWLAFEQNQVEPTLAVVRFVVRFLAPDHPRAAAVPPLRSQGEAALGWMDRHLETSPMFLDERFTIADIALYAYTHNADEGGFELGRWPSVTAWLRRVETQRGFVPMSA